MKLSVVIPVYNGEYTLEKLHNRLKKELKDMISYEVIFVYDCGKDKSWNIIKELVKDNPGTVKGYHLNKNYGQHDAILFGLGKSESDFIVTMDEDLQHDPVYIKELLKKQKEGDYDVVYAVFKSAKHPGLRNLTSDVLRKVLKVIIPGIFPDYSPYRLMKKDIAQSLTKLHNSYTFIDGYLGWIKPKFGTIKAIHNKRTAGKSSYSVYRLLKHALFVTIAYSPLKKWLLYTALGVNLISFLFYKLLVNYAVPASIYMVGFIVGIILLFLALAAEIMHYGRMKLVSTPVALKEI